MAVYPPPNIGYQNGTLSPMNSKWLRDLSGLAQICLWVLVLLPADRVHGVPGLTRRHDDP